MTEEKLFTRDGGYVTTVIVPVLTPKAEVLIWGARFFVWQNTTQRYVEGLALTALQTKEG